MVESKRRLAAALACMALAGSAAGQHLYKCEGTYQDRPCADADVQKRFAHGRFDVDQANPDTDRDCARAVSELMPLWKRLQAGESVERVRAQIDARPIPPPDKSRQRELLVALREVDVRSPTARSQLETRCMADKRARAAPAGVHEAAATSSLASQARR